MEWCFFHNIWRFLHFRMRSIQNGWRVCHIYAENVLCFADNGYSHSKLIRMDNLFSHPTMAGFLFTLWSVYINLWVKNCGVSVLHFSPKWISGSFSKYWRSNSSNLLWRHHHDGDKCQRITKSFSKPLIDV